MKQKYNRIWSLALAGILTISNAIPAAASVESDGGASVQQEETTEDPAANTLSEDNTDSSSEEPLPQKTESNISDDSSDIDAAFLYAETSEDGANQNVVIKLDTDETLSFAALQSETSGNQEETDASEIIENYALFTLPLSENRTFQEITYTINGTEYTTSLLPLEQGKKLDEEDFQEALETESDTGIAAYSLDDEADTISAQAEAVEEYVITTNLDEAITAQDLESSVTTVPKDSDTQTTTASSQKKVIVLDPGHGAAGTGTGRDWGDFVTDEATINYKITTYTKQALEANYANIAVYTTKVSQNENPSLEKRVQYAVDKHADIFVSQHINATGQQITEVNGSLAMVPKLDSSHQYHQEAAQSSRDLARSILDELVKLGFNDMNFQERLSENNTKYPDGSLADYYGIVKRCRENNLPGTIIEHGFANNRHDALMFNNENMLKKIGEADAKGIASYLKLSQGTSTPPSDNTGVAGHTFTNTSSGNSNSGSAGTGWKKVDNQWYYYDSKGNKTTGWQKVEGLWYYMNANGVMLTGWQLINGKYYYLTSSGAMATGWILLNGTWYYLDSSGAMLTGFQKINGKTYYLKEDSGAMVTGLQVINGKEYRFDSSGAALSGWQKISGKWYYMDTNGAVLTGWQLISGVWYYLEPQHGVMQTGWQLINGTWYYMNGSGAMLTGWQKIGSTWYYMNASGAMASDTWIGAYYVDASGAWIQGKTPQSGSQTGTVTNTQTSSQTAKWILSGKRWWYRHADGSYTKSGWEKINGTWYLFDASGWMLTGWQKVKGTWYYMDGSGAMLTGWQKVGGTWYYLAGSGAMLTGWQKVGGTWYYMNGSGAMLTGWQFVNGKWYYMNTSGAMLTGWQTIKGERYYLDQSGAMLTGTHTIDGQTYTFRSSGALTA